MSGPRGSVFVQVPARTKHGLIRESPGNLTMMTNRDFIRRLRNEDEHRNTAKDLHQRDAGNQTQFPVLNCAAHNCHLHYPGSFRTARQKTNWRASCVETGSELACYRRQPDIPKEKLIYRNINRTEFVRDLRKGIPTGGEFEHYHVAAVMPKLCSGLKRGGAARGGEKADDLGRRSPLLESLNRGERQGWQISPRLKRAGAGVGTMSGRG